MFYSLSVWLKVDIYRLDKKKRETLIFCSLESFTVPFWFLTFMWFTAQKNLHVLQAGVLNYGSLKGSLLHQFYFFPVSSEKKLISVNFTSWNVKKNGRTHPETKLTPCDIIFSSFRNQSMPFFFYKVSKRNRNTEIGFAFVLQFARRLCGFLGK